MIGIILPGDAAIRRVAARLPTLTHRVRGSDRNRSIAVGLLVVVDPRPEVPSEANTDGKRSMRRAMAKIKFIEPRTPFRSASLCAAVFQCWLRGAVVGTEFEGVITPHAQRRTTLTLRLASGTSICVVSRMLGHAIIAIRERGHITTTPPQPAPGPRLAHQPARRRVVTQHLNHHVTNQRDPSPSGKEEGPGIAMIPGPRCGP